MDGWKEEQIKRAPPNNRAPKAGSRRQERVEESSEQGEGSRDHLGRRKEEEQGLFAL